MDKLFEHMASPRISVVLPTYNQAQYLGQAIQSVLAQTFADWELILVDDGSTDATPQCVAQFQDSRVRYIVQHNEERSRARNRGIREARGALIAFLDADDFWLPAYLATQVAKMDAYPSAGLSYTWNYDTNVTGQIIGRRGYGKSGLQDQDEFFKAMLLGNRMIVDCVVVRAAIIQDAGCFDPDIVHVEDWDLWLRISRTWPVLVIAEPLACYRRYDVFMPSRLIKRNADAGYIRVIEKAGDYIKEASLHPMHVEALAEAHWRSAWLRFAVGDIGVGQARMTAANDLHPGLFAPPYSRFIQSIAYLADELHDVETPLDVALTCINRVFDHLPAWARSLNRVRKRALGQYCGLHVFRSYWRGNRLGIMKAGALAITYKPAWLRNRGFVAILGRASLSPRFPPHLERASV